MSLEGDGYTTCVKINSLIFWLRLEGVGRIVLCSWEIEKVFHEAAVGMTCRRQQSVAWLQFAVVTTQTSTANT